MTRADAAWLAVAASLCVTALVGWVVPRDWIDWQPGAVWHQPWRAWTAVGVHYSVEHFWANLAGVALAGGFGVVARVPARLAVAWLAAWPLTHLGLLVKPELTHYGGLSGVVHAGVAAVITCVLITGDRRQRIVGTLVLIGFVSKLLSEAPWGAALRHTAGWDIAVAPIVHTTGSLAGALCAALVLLGVPPRASASPR